MNFTGACTSHSGYTTLSDIRPALTASFVAAGSQVASQEVRWAKDIASTIRELVGQKVRIGMERMNAGAALALGKEGFDIVDAQEPLELARSIKCGEEVACIRAALRATESAVEHMLSALKLLRGWRVLPLISRC
jgi:Xaa-Pro aminopeptidase